MGQLIWILLIGIMAGWLGGKIMKGHGFGIAGDLAVGVVGSVIGGVLFEAIGLRAYGIIGTLITATVGAMVLIYAMRVVTGHDK